MRNEIYIHDIAAHDGQEVTLRGWLYGKRSSGKLHFLQVRDGTGVIQCVLSKKDVPEAVFEAGAPVPPGALVGERRQVADDSPRAPGLQVYVGEFKIPQGGAR